MSLYLGFDPTSEKNYYFVSYNSDDAERLTAILCHLNESGIPLWYDYGLDYGDEKWRAQIGRKIEGSQAVILFVTKNLFLKFDTFVRVECSIAKEKCNLCFRRALIEYLIHSVTVYDDDDGILIETVLNTTGRPLLSSVDNDGIHKKIDADEPLYEEGLYAIRAAHQIYSNGLSCLRG